MGNYQIILFDLDGTISDPKEGITKSIQYALQKLGKKESDLRKLERFIDHLYKNHLWNIMVIIKK